MWPPDNLDQPSVADWVAQGAALPRLSSDLRRRILGQATVAHRRSQSVERIQKLTTSLLAAALLLWLPAYYRLLRDDGLPPAVPSTENWRTAIYESPMAALPSAVAADGFEWGLVQAELTVRDYSARAFRDAL